MSERKCDNCGGPLKVENYAEATITSGPCGFLYAAHFGGGEVQEEPCRDAPLLNVRPPK